jgi:hypothetical protein
LFFFFVSWYVASAFVYDLKTVFFYQEWRGSLRQTCLQACPSHQDHTQETRIYNPDGTVLPPHSVASPQNKFTSRCHKNDYFADELQWLQSQFEEATGRFPRHFACGRS